MLPSTKTTINVGNKEIILETGHMARNAAGSVVLTCEDTVLLVAVSNSDEPREGIDFFPLLVDFEEKMFSVGKIPGSFFRREGKPTDKSVLTSRLIDRPIRPLFPKGYKNDVQITASMLSADGINPPDVLAVLGASVGLMISGLPFLGPIGCVRVGRLNGEFIANPTYDQIDESDLDIVVAGTRDSVMMVEAGANFVSEEDILNSIKFAQTIIAEQVEVQEKFVKELGVEKQQFEMDIDLEPLEKFISEICEEDIKAAYQHTNREERQKVLKEIKKKLNTAIDELDEEHPVAIIIDSSSTKHHNEIFKGLEKKVMRSMIVDQDLRVDGRSLTEVRPIDCSVGILPRVHGTGLFTRGNTQVLSILTLGGPGDAQELDGIDPQKKRRYLHHYSFPAYSVGEVRPNRGPGRREVGHGYLAERALLPVLPKEEDFPYTIRINSEVIESNGSTSMASTCGSTLTLMDAGVPISQPVAGVAMGLIKEGDTVKVLTDIQGVEDFLGDMDFKVTGGSEGITALQMDIKILGISIEILEKALAQAKEGRLHILGKMLEVIDKPRTELSKWAPRILSMKVDTDSIGSVIGPGGKTIRSIIEQTGAAIDINDDGQVNITCSVAGGGEKAMAIIKKLTRKIVRGMILSGKVVRILPNLGAFIELGPNMDGMVHISQLVPRRVNSVSEVVAVGDEVIVKVNEVDDKGRINLTMKGVTPEEKDKFLEEDYC